MLYLYKFKGFSLHLCIQYGRELKVEEKHKLSSFPPPPPPHITGPCWTCFQSSKQFSRALQCARSYAQHLGGKRILPGGEFESSAEWEGCSGEVLFCFFPF